MYNITLIKSRDLSIVDWVRVQLRVVLSIILDSGLVGGGGAKVAGFSRKSPILQGENAYFPTK